MNEENFNYFRSAVLNCPAYIEPLLDFGCAINEDYGDRESEISWLEGAVDPPHVLAKIVIRQLVKMKHQNLQISEKILKDILDNEKFNEFWNKCEAEVKIIKEKDGFYNLLVSKDLNDLAEVADLKANLNIFRTNEHKAAFPIYADYLNKQIRKGEEFVINSVIRMQSRF